MKNLRYKVLFGFLAFVLVLANCSNPAGDETDDPPEQGENTGPVTPKEDEVNITYYPQDPTIPPLVDEMSFNYALLRYFYFYAGAELGPYAQYADAGGGAPYGNVAAMYAGMSDRWTRYWVPEEAAGIWSQITTSGAERKLVGITLRVKEIAGTAQPDELYVALVWMGSPAEAAGIRRDDRIMGINGVDLTTDPALKGDALLERYQAAADTDTISLTLLRNGEAVSVPSVTKKVMRPPSVFLDYYDDIPVIQLTGFDTDSGYDEAAPDKKSNTAKEFHAALTKVKNGKYPVGIIDIRGNSGGSIDQCYACIDELVAEGIYIRSEEHDVAEMGSVEVPTIKKTAKWANPGGLGETIQWLFLADAGSASAAEIMLYAVKNSRPETQIFGTKTYGKGVGQWYRLTYFARGLSAITAFQFFDKDGNTYHLKGIAPDVPVNAEDALEAAIAAIKQAQGKSVLDASPADRAAIRALNSRLIGQQIPPDGIRGGAWKLR